MQTTSENPALWQGVQRHLPSDLSSLDSAVLLLHGLGADAHDLIGLADEMAAGLPRTVFISPNAPFACDMAPMGRQWFSLLDWTPANVIAGIEKAAPMVEQMIADVAATYNLPYNRIALLGFSQGCMMSLHVAPRLSQSLAGVVGCSGALMAPERLAAETVSRPPILLTHGQLDPVVPYGAMPASAAALQAVGFAVETVTRPMLAHGIDDTCLTKSLEFLQLRLNPLAKA